MTSVANKESKYHHWWPVGLQKFWRDENKHVHWIEPNGSVFSKRSDQKNRDIGHSEHGHAIFRDTAWKSNFESLFSIDDSIGDIFDGLKYFEPYCSPKFSLAFDSIGSEFFGASGPALSVYPVDQKLYQRLLLLALSLMIRSPAARWRYSMYNFGRAVDEETAKVNIATNYRAAKQLCSVGATCVGSFVLLHSREQNFILGDGYFDQVTDSLVFGRIHGRALVPLTPSMCLYFRAPVDSCLRGKCISLFAEPGLVDSVNELTQIYSIGHLFFNGKPPKILPAFSNNRPYSHDVLNDATVRILDNIAGYKPQSIRGGMEPFDG